MPAFRLFDFRSPLLPYCQGLRLRAIVARQLLGRLLLAAGAAAMH
eukprot:COSAG01_NODE_8725_length_2681_cov_35.567626_4_plen_44_part_01